MSWKVVVGAILFLVVATFGTGMARVFIHYYDQYVARVADEDCAANGGELCGKSLLPRTVTPGETDDD